MNPAHANERWHPSRTPLDAGYALELLIEVPLCAWMLVLCARQDPGRHLFQAFALAVQMTGTVTYYLPGLVQMEFNCWLSLMDRLCGSVWMIYPVLTLWDMLAEIRNSQGDVKKRRSPPEELQNMQQFKRK
eukprot:CAMPEP_0197693764 /NCGR_PEP_ID=MMETSP1338-20131121/112957_1 /TAXON_ID=43686 ORGANISM="Pelagodinium beii, Strain RCC1491" /NCGR_SAMPLE_ID=MMETSP1338 /ASSEMBLY_ACC=CAM_ASM_000754 /LENGTH=130 /DNA_ID=CAMNT_0043276549 /DNA_START=109 /DNA_END=499 /DNA_ORIENTATION=-